MISVERVGNIGDDLDWLEFLRNQNNLFYNHDFLKYNDHFKKKINWHHLKFRDSRNSKIIAIMTGCELEEDGVKRFISCNGVSFGGFWWKRRTNVVDYLKTIDSFLEYQKENSFDKVTLRTYPFLYDFIPCEENEYALLYKGFRITRVSVTNIVNLHDFSFSDISEKKRAIKRASSKFQFKTFDPSEDHGLFDKLYNILLKDRGKKNVLPTHSLQELKFLKKNLSDKINIFYSAVDENIVGVCYLFEVTPDVILNFYLAIDGEYSKEGASDFTLYKTIEWAKEKGYKYYDIGTSDIKGKLLEGLFTFKRRFLGYGFLRKVFEYNLN